MIFFNSIQNVSIGLVGENHPFKIFDEEETSRYLALIENEERRTTAAAASVPAPDDTPDDSANAPTEGNEPGSMETDQII